MLQLKTALEEERCKVLQMDNRLEKIIETSSYFVDRSQDFLEVLNTRMARPEDDAEIPEGLPAKDHQALKRDHNLVEFAINTAEDFKKTIKRTQVACSEYFKRFLNACNRCQTEAELRFEEFPDHETFVDILQKGHQDAKARTQQIQSIDAMVLKNEVGHAAISIQILEDQLRLSPARIEAIRNQVDKFEINIQFLEPCAFEGLAGEAAAWKKFFENQAGSSS